MIVYFKNFRKGFATNSSSTHSVIYKTKEEVFDDLNIFRLNFYDRCDATIAASKEAKIKYVAANIFWDEKLFDIMCKYYPQMLNYASLAEEERKHEDNRFGMAMRGMLSFRDETNILASIEYLKYIIESEDIIIVGGSDEEDFVYETCEGHQEVTTPEDIHSSSVFRNGNYYVGYGYYGKIRFAVSDEPCIPEYPELIDLKITNMCNHNCPFCYQGSSMQGQHADIADIKYLISRITASHKRCVEFSIGGGNILLYPQLDDLFYYIHNLGHIINTTIKAQDCVLLNNDEQLKTTFKRYVTSIGISVSSLEDVDCLPKRDSFANNFFNKWGVYDLRITSFVIHLIPEYLGVDLTRNIIDECQKRGYYSFLFLGYKENERGKTQKYCTFSDEDLAKLFKDTSISIDTTFANRYKEWIKDNYAVDKTLTYNEGEYSMYVDAVTNTAYKSSYQLDKPYPLKGMWPDKSYSL